MSGLAGVWMLRSYVMEDVETGLRNARFGENPRGTLILHPDGRMAAIMTPAEQPVPETHAQQAAAFRDLIAYSGRYRLDPPDRFITSVDIAWYAAWVGGEQVRTYRLDGDRLEITSDPVRLPRGETLVRGVLVWERERPPGTA
jgi:hypothetical protein